MEGRAALHREPAHPLPPPHARLCTVTVSSLLCHNALCLAFLFFRCFHPQNNVRTASSAQHRIDCQAMGRGRRLLSVAGITTGLACMVSVCISVQASYRCCLARRPRTQVRPDRSGACRPSHGGAEGAPAAVLLTVAPSYICWSAPPEAAPLSCRRRLLPPLLPAANLPALPLLLPGRSFLVPIDSTETVPWGGTTAPRSRRRRRSSTMQVAGAPASLLPQIACLAGTHAANVAPPLNTRHMVLNTAAFQPCDAGGRGAQVHREQPHGGHPGAADGACAGAVGERGRWLGVGHKSMPWAAGNKLVVMAGGLLLRYAALTLAVDR